MAESFDPSRFEGRVAAFQDAIRIDPDDPAAYVDSAILGEAMDLSPNFAVRLAEVYVVAGRTADLEQLIASMPKPILDSFWAILAARQGDRETALRYLETFLQQHRPVSAASHNDAADQPRSQWPHRTTPGFESTARRTSSRRVPSRRA